MKLFYVVATRLNMQMGQTKVVLTEELSSEYDSSDIETYLAFEEKPKNDLKLQIAFFTADEIETLMSIKNKTIPWGSKQMLKGMSVRHFDNLFSYVENVEVKEITLDF